MNILFLTISSSIENLETRGIYTDLMRRFRDSGHAVYIMFPRERRLGLPTQVIVENNVYSLGVRTLNVTKTNVVEKGIGQLLLELQYKVALKKYWKNVKFDLILYSTPPITFTSVIKYAKRNNPDAISYLLLKDIFPQNALDLNLLSKTGYKGIIYKYFRYKEKELYKISDYIGCMSPANVKYVIEHNPYLLSDKVEIAPNSYEVNHRKAQSNDTELIRKKYNLPLDKIIFIYGGNMGQPQGIPFLVDCLNAIKYRSDCHFVIVGNGTEYFRLEKWYKSIGEENSISVFNYLPKDDYDNLTRACDVGLIFLDYRFTIPNYPSRLLPYLMERKPIIAVTDPNCDTGTIAQENGYGYYCPSNSVKAFIQTVEKMLVSDIKSMGENGYNYFLNNYTVEHTYKVILKKVINDEQ